VPFLKISAPEVVSGMSGESEAKIRELFDQALEMAPCIVFIDEIDAITPKRESAQREMERRIVAQLLTSMDDLSVVSGEGKPVVVIGATNRPEALVCVHWPMACARSKIRIDPNDSIGIGLAHRTRRCGGRGGSTARFHWASLTRTRARGSSRCCAPSCGSTARLTCSPWPPAHQGMDGKALDCDLSPACHSIPSGGGFGQCVCVWFKDTPHRWRHRYVGADLVALTREAAVIAVNRIFQTLLASHPPVRHVRWFGLVWLRVCRDAHDTCLSLPIAPRRSRWRRTGRRCGRM
jgi:hypothetical protein